jgi:hypothetical protein
MKRNEIKRSQGQYAWGKRYCVLKPIGLFYFRVKDGTQQDVLLYGKPIGAVDVQNALILPVQDSSSDDDEKEGYQKFSFCIRPIHEEQSIQRSQFQEPIYFSANSLEEMNDWIQRIEQISSKKNTLNDSFGEFVLMTSNPEQPTPYQWDKETTIEIELPSLIKSVESFFFFFFFIILEN